MSRQHGQPAYRLAGLCLTVLNVISLTWVYMFQQHFRYLNHPELALKRGHWKPFSHLCLGKGVATCTCICDVHVWRCNISCITNCFVQNRHTYRASTLPVVEMFSFSFFSLLTHVINTVLLVLTAAHPYLKVGVEQRDFFLNEPLQQLLQFLFSTTRCHN